MGNLGKNQLLLTTSLTINGFSDIKVGSATLAKDLFVSSQGPITIGDNLFLSNGNIDIHSGTSIRVSANTVVEAYGSATGLGNITLSVGNGVTGDGVPNSEVNFSETNGGRIYWGAGINAAGPGIDLFAIAANIKFVAESASQITLESDVTLIADPPIVGFPSEAQTGLPYNDNTIPVSLAPNSGTLPISRMSLADPFRLLLSAVPKNPQTEGIDNVEIVNVNNNNLTSKTLQSTSFHFSDSIDTDLACKFAEVRVPKHVAALLVEDDNKLEVYCLYNRSRSGSIVVRVPGRDGQFEAGIGKALLISKGRRSNHRSDTASRNRLYLFSNSTVTVSSAEFSLLSLAQNANLFALIGTDSSSQKLKSRILKLFAAIGLVVKDRNAFSNGN